ncbi:MAG: polysaccharide biosynthesis/export family protein [Acidobacteriota bacterium]
MPRSSVLILVGLVLGAIAVEVLAQPGRYRIGPRDRVQIRVQELPSLDGEQEVADDGTLTFAAIGVIDAQGLTEDELGQRIRRRLIDQGLRRATVTVTVDEYRSRPVAVIGAVGSPGNHLVPGRPSLLEVLLTAGGLGTEHGPVIQVRRRADNGLTDQVEISVRDLIEVGDPAVNIPIFAGDLINVPPAVRITVHFLGEVNNVGSQTFGGGERVTLLTAIAHAGGLTEAASNKIRIQRLGPDGERTEILADFRRVLDGKDPDPELVAGDLIVVKESFF